MEMMVLNEVLENFNYDVLEEEIKKGFYYIRGIFSKADVVNKNKRLYPKDVLREAVDDIQESVKNNGFVGECEHPSSPKINLDRMSHKITKLEMMEDGSMVGEMKLLDTPMGNIIKSLVKENIRLGVSTRGLGKVVKKDYLGESVDFVQPNYKLRAIDIVFDPSAGEHGRPQFVVEEATPNGILLGGTSNFEKVWKEVFES